jgi:hypothetical protein
MKPAGGDRRASKSDGGQGLLRLRHSFDRAADIDEVVGDDAEADPATRSDRPLVAATAETVSLFEDANAHLTSGAPLLPLRNQRFFCLRLRSRLLVERLGMQTRLTPLPFAVFGRGVSAVLARASVM